MAVVIAAIAVLLALLFLASRAVARSPGFVAGWMRGASFTPPPPPPGTQEDDDFRWRWRAGALRSLHREAPPVPMLEELMTTPEEPDLHAERLQGHVGRRS